jgi:hypothetical protein
MEPVRAMHLCGNAEADQRRRLHFLLVALSSLEPAAAIEVARCMEEFVVGMTVGTTDGRPAGAPSGERSSKIEGPNDPGSAPAVVLKEVTSKTTQQLRGAGSESSTRNRSLDDAQRRAFAEAVATGATNDELAVRFGLTRRQANVLRIGLVKLQREVPILVQPTGRPSSAEQLADHEQQEQFLRKKPTPSVTIDDVVRFLRQLGDIVVRQDDHYLVNHSLSLTAQELIIHANRKRTARGKPVFDLDDPRQSQQSQPAEEA